MLSTIQDRKESKQSERAKEKEIISANAGPSKREIECEQLNNILRKENLIVS